MNAVYTMTINGGAVTRCDELGWSLESITRRNLAPDVCALRRMHTGKQTLARGDTVVIYADGVRIFTGKAQSPQISITDGGATVNAQILGPWQAMMETPFIRGQPRFKGTGATATATLTGGAVTSIAVNTGGSDYIDAVIIIEGDGTGAKARANVSTSGVVTSITMLAGGAGYTTPPTVNVLGLTQIPPQLGETFVVTSGGGFKVQDPVTGVWSAPPSTTTYKWARQTNLAASPKELDLAIYTGTRGLLCDPNWWGFPIYRTVQAEVRSVLRQFLLSRQSLEAVDRPDLTPAFTVDLDGIETGLGASASPRYRTWSDQKVGGLLSTLLAVKPDAASWFDYGPAVPELHMRVASLETETALTLGAAPLISVNATPRPELKPEGVVIRWEYTDATSWWWRGYRNPAHIDKSPATVLPHEPGVLTHTLDFSTDIAQFKPDLASSLMASLGTLRATGSLTLGAMSLTEALAIRPGLCFRLSGDEMLASSQLLVQECTWNATTNQVQCTLGYPRALDLQTINDLRGWITITCQGFLASRTDLAPPPP